MFSSSGIKRGLATTAISALAVAGLPALAGTAHADSINDLVGAGGVELYTQYSGQASTQNDGTNNTVHLLAGGGSDVVQVRFEYGPAASPTTIATVSRTNGVFSTEWAPPAALLGTTVDVRAVGLNSVGTEITGAESVASTAISANVAAIDIANAPGSALGIFDQPYGVEPEEVGLPGDGVDHSTSQGIVTGSTSGAGNITLSDRVAGSPARPAFAPGAAGANGVRPFRGTVDFQDYDLSGTPDEAVVGAAQAGGSDDAEVVNLESQAITTVTAVAEPANVPTGGTSTGVITVTDAQGRPVAGAQVIFDANNNNAWDGASNGGTEQSRYTDANGQARFAGLASSPGGSTYAFFVNTDGGDDYDPAIDFRRTVTVSSFAQVPTTVTTSSADGNAFDVDEYTAGDLQVQVNDQNGAGIPGQTVQYSYSFVPFTATTPAPTPPPSGTVTTGANGSANIPFASVGSGTYTLSTYIERNGTPGQQAGDLSGTDRVFKAGDSTLAFSEAPVATSTAGTTDTYEAGLTLGDGTPLPGRAVQFTYAPTGNVVVAAQANQPAGTTRNSNTQATGTTNAQGLVSVALSDPAQPDQAELNGVLDAATITNTFGNAAEDAEDLEVDFVDNTPPAGTTVTVSPLAEGKPGVATGGSVTVVADADNNAATPPTPVVGQAVTLQVSEGAFFTNGTPPAGAAVGQDARLENLGKTITVVTDANGTATFQTTIERDENFDNDGMASATVTASAGAVTGSTMQMFDSSDPLNGGEVVLEQSPDSEQDNPTDPTRVGDSVLYDVTTTDQFGNVVGGEDVEIEAEGGAVFFSPAESDFEADGDFEVFTDEAGTVTVTASWTTGTVVYVVDGADAGTEPDPQAGPDETLTDTAEADFYEVDFEESAFTITSSPEGELEVGTAVTETVTVIDQEGNPVEGLNVQFIRSGPGEQDGDTNANRTTNANGRAFYNFVGTEAGTAQISAIVSEEEGSAPLQTLTDDVVFVGEDDGPDPEEPTEITARLTGSNNGGKADRPKLTTSPQAAAAGTLAKLFTRRNGRNVLLAEKRLNANGAATFTTRDRNGNRVTRYFAVVQRTENNTYARTADRKIR